MLCTARAVKTGIPVLPPHRPMVASRSTPARCFTTSPTLTLARSNSRDFTCHAWQAHWIVGQGITTVKLHSLSTTRETCKAPRINVESNNYARFGEGLFLPVLWNEKWLTLFMTYVYDVSRMDACKTYLLVYDTHTCVCV